MTDLEVWKAIGIVTLGITGLWAVIGIVVKTWKASHRTRLRVAKAYYTLVGREGNPELGIEPVLGVAGEFREVRGEIRDVNEHLAEQDVKIAEAAAKTDHATWHLGNGDEVPLHTKFEDLVKEVRALAERVERSAERRVADHGIKARSERHDDPGAPARGTLSSGRKTREGTP